jgi:hypothetical protein
MEPEQSITKIMSAESMWQFVTDPTGWKMGLRSDGLTCWSSGGGVSTVASFFKSSMLSSAKTAATKKRLQTKVFMIVSFGGRMANTK